MFKMRKTPLIKFLSLGSLFFVFVVSAIIYWFGDHFRRSLEWSNHSHDVLTRLSKIAGMMETAETSQRGYMLTDRAEFLKPYYLVEKDILPKIEELRNSVIDNPEQSQKVDAIREAATERLEHIDSMISYMEDGKKDLAIRLVKEGNGQVIMNRFRSAVAEFERTETILLNQRFNTADEYFEQMTITVAACLLSAFAFGFGIIFLLRKEITSKEIIQVELEAAKIKALESSDLKTKFLANMSHEIRTPLNGIIGMTQMILKTKLDKDQKGFVEVIRDASQSLLILINEILDLSKIESGKLDLEDVNFELRSLVQSAISILKFSAHSKGVNINVSIDSELPDHFSGDSLRIRQVLINLLSNGIKFSDSTPVTLRVSLLERYDSRARLKFEIEDKGIGIDEAVQRKLFSQFTQGDQSTTRKYGGTGLGLSISKQLVELMGGKIGLRSEKGTGSVFYFDLPLRVVTIENPEVTTTGSNDGEAKFSGQTVLVAEDNAINQRVIQAMLSESGCLGVIVENGAKAIDALKSNNFSLIIMDGHMPVMDGYETTRRIRDGEAGDNNRSIPILAATANAVKGDLEKCIEAGMNDYLPKPLLLQDFEIKLKKWLAQDGSFLNKNVLEGLISLSPNGTKSLLLDVIGIFITSVPESIQKMRRFHAERNFESLRKEAHHLKSSCGNVGATTMYDLCYRLEKIKATDEELILALLDVMDKNFQLTKKELERYASN